MTDTELLDGLQRLYNAKVVSLQTCRSGVKVAISERDHILGNCRDYFGSEFKESSMLGPDIRIAIVRALEGEKIG